MRGVLKIFGATGEQLEQLRVVHNFRALRIMQHRKERLQRFALRVHPDGAAFARLGGDFNAGDARAEAFGFAFAGFEVEPHGQGLFCRQFRQVFAKLGDGGELRVVGFRDGLGSGWRRHRFGGQFSQQRIESQFAIERGQRGAVRRGAPAIPKVLI